MLITGIFLFNVCKVSVFHDPAQIHHFVKWIDLWEPKYRNSVTLAILSKVSFPSNSVTRTGFMPG